MGVLGQIFINVNIFPTKTTMSLYKFYLRTIAF